MAYAITVEIENMCRACLTTTESMKDIYSVCSPEVFMECTSVEISEDDCLPRMICEICLDLLNKFRYFREVVVRSNIILRGHGPILQLPEDFEITEENQLTLNELELCDRRLDDIVCIEPMLPEEIVLQSEALQEITIPESSLELPPLNQQTHKQDTLLPFSGDLKSTKSPNSDETVPHSLNEVKKKHIQCDDCKRWFGSKKNLTSHMRVHTKVKKYLCTICGKYFGYLNILKTHELIHAGIKKYACDICGAEFVQSFNLKIHIKAHMNEKSYRCSKCGKGFSQAGNLKDHLIRHTGIKSLACHICDMRFFVKGDLKKHMKCHSSERPFPCELCDKMFKRRSVYEVHMRSHTGERPYACQYCPKKFMTAQDLRHHTMIHTGTKPHKCSLCHQAFIQKCALNRHMKSHMRRAEQAALSEQKSELDGDLGYSVTIFNEHQDIELSMP